MLSPYTTAASQPLQPCRSKHLLTIIAFIFIIICSIGQTYGQSRDKYQLLWRIDGPGIKQSSYLYGSMHLRDPRVFEFSDSVLLAFNQANTFAMEIDMDTLMNYMLAPDGPLQDTSNYLIKVLKPKEYHFIDSLVKVKSGLHIHELRIKSFWMIERLLLDQEEALAAVANNKDQRQYIFLDGWFHEKAAALNKKRVGLEDIGNQTGYFKSGITQMDKEMLLAECGYYGSMPAGDAPANITSTDETGHYTDSIVNLYYNGDLGPIGHWMNQGMPAGSDELKLMEKRNSDMANSIAHIVPNSSLFAVIGVGHLTGKNSVLDHLRKKGFTVTPVVARFTGIAAKYTEEYNKLKGYSLSRIAEGYTAQLPGAPFTYAIPGSNSKMYFSANETDNEAAFAFSVSIAPTGNKTAMLRKNMMDNMARKSGGTASNIQEIEYLGIAGTQGDYYSNNYLFRSRVFIRKKRAYVFMHTITEADTSKAVAFFNSVRFNDISTVAATYGPLPIKGNGLTVQFPQQYESFNIGNAAKLDVKGQYEETYTASDDEKEINYTLYVHKMVPGYYLKSDSMMVVEFKQRMLLNDSLVKLLNEQTTEEHGLKTITYQLTSPEWANGSLKYICRGNMMYILIAQYKAAQPPAEVTAFLNNYTITPISTTSLNTSFTAEDSSFTIKGPVEYSIVTPLFKENGAMGTDATYASYDPKGEAMYFVVEKIISPYTSSEPYNLIESGLFPPADTSTFISTTEKRYEQDGMYFYDASYLNRNTHGTILNRRAVIRGHHAYLFSVLVTKEAQESGAAKVFLDSIQWNKATMDTFNIQRNKINSLIADLKSTDTATYMAAKKTLMDVPLDSNVRAQLYQLMFDDIPLNNYVESPSPVLKYKIYTILNRFRDIHNTEDNIFSTAKQLTATQQLYKEATTIEDQRWALYLMSAINSDDAYTNFMTLADKLPRDAVRWGSTTSYSIPAKLYFDKHLPDVIKSSLVSKNLLAYMSVTVPDSLWESPAYEQSGVNRLVPQMVELYKETRAKVKANGDNHATNLIRLMALLSQPSLAKGNSALFRQMLTDSITMAKHYGAIGLLSLHQPVADKELKALITDDSRGLYFIQELDNRKLLGSVNHLLTAAQITRLQTLDYMSEEDIEPDTLSLIRQLTVRKDNIISKYFLYKYTTRVLADTDADLQRTEVDPEDMPHETVTGYVLVGGQPITGNQWNLKNPFFRILDEKPEVLTDKYLSDLITQKEQTTEREIYNVPGK